MKVYLCQLFRLVKQAYIYRGSAEDAAVKRRRESTEAAGELAAGV